jgi:O-antigen ligase
MKEWFDREKAARLADMLAVAVAVSLPWSTSATGILVVAWLIVALPALEPIALRRTLLSPAGGLPVALFAVGALGMLWADVTWTERFHGLGSFAKLLVIPLLIAQFRTSDRGQWVLAGFFYAATALLVLSFVTVMSPNGDLWSHAKFYGIPVKDSIAQSAEFTLCAFAALYLAWRALLDRRYGIVAAYLVLIAGFLGNTFYVAASRTALLTMPILLAAFALRQLAWRAQIAVTVAAVAAAGLVWISSPYLRERVGSIPHEIERYRENLGSSAGERLEFWRKSVIFIEQAPLFGHGTGTIGDLFRKAAVGETGVRGEVATNPHSQIFAVAIQVGALGVAVLIAMWVAHFLVFRGEGLASWVGLVVVLQNVVGSMLNSHLFDFTHGWIYVFGVGVTAGMVSKPAGVTDTTETAKPAVRATAAPGVGRRPMP